jgi:hypothetical protein
MKRNLSGFCLAFEIDVKCCIIARVMFLLFFFFKLVSMEEFGTCIVWNLWVCYWEY